MAATIFDIGLHTGVVAFSIVAAVGVSTMMLAYMADGQSKTLLKQGTYGLVFLGSVAMGMAFVYSALWATETDSVTTARTRKGARAWLGWAMGIAFSSLVINYMNEDHLLSAVSIINAVMTLTFIVSPDVSMVKVRNMTFVSSVISMITLSGTFLPIPLSGQSAKTGL